MAIEKTTECIGRFHHGTVATDPRHRGQCVHFLSPAEGPGQRINRQGCDFFGRQLLHQIGVLGRPQKAHQRLPRVHQSHFFGDRRTHLENNVTAAPQRRRIGGNGRTGLHIVGVGQVCEVTRALFHHHRKAEFDQFGHHIGHGGDALFAGENFSRHANALRRWGVFACLHDCLLAQFTKNGQYVSLTQVIVLKTRTSPV